MNDANWNAPDLQRQLNQSRGYVYLLVDRSPSNPAKQVLKVGSTSAAGWRKRFNGFRTWALEGKFWADGVQSSGWQLTVYVFAVPNGQQETIESAVRAAFYNATGSAHQDLMRDYTDPRKGGRWADFNSPPAGAGERAMVRSPVSDLNLTDLFSGTAFAGVTATRVIDLNHTASVGTTALRGLSGRNWVYLLEGRGLPADLQVLKVGQTANPYQRINNDDLLSYRSMAKHEMSMAMVLFELTDAFIQQLPQELQDQINAASTDQRKREVVEDAMRRAIYNKGYQLEIDHSRDDWRSRPGDLLKNDRTNTVASTLTTPSRGTWA